MKNIDFGKNTKKYLKIQKFIAPKLMIVDTSGWRHLKEKNKFFLGYEYQKKYHPSPKMTQLSKIDHESKMENFISPLRFKKSNYVIRLFSNKSL